MFIHNMQYAWMHKRLFPFVFPTAIPAVLVLITASQKEALHGKSGNGLFDMAQTPSPPLRLHQSLKGDDAASLRRVAPSFLFIQATLRNVAAPICSRLSDISGAGGGRGEKLRLLFPQRLFAAFGGRKRLPAYNVSHSLRKREEPFIW